MPLAVRDVTALLQVHLRVHKSRFDRSCMKQPEFSLSTRIVFRSVQHGGIRLQASWQVFRSFSEFQGLDAQLRLAFPDEMKLLAPPLPHRRRTWLRRHCSPKFLVKRCVELNDYFVQLLQLPHLRLTRFLDPRASLVLRCFCNFETGLLTSEVTVLPNQFEDFVLSLDSRDRDKNQVNCNVNKSGGESGTTVTSSECSAPLSGSIEVNEKGDERAESSDRVRNQSQVLTMVGKGTDDNAKLDELEANLMDDKTRHIVVCTKFECACRVSPFRVAHNKMKRMLQHRGFKQVYAPPADTALTALYCVLYKLQQLNDLDKRLFDALTRSSFTTTTKMEIVNDGSIDENTLENVADDHSQLSVGVELLRHTLANYGLLHVHALERHFRTSAVDLKQILHEFKSRRQLRVGNVELVLLATMLDLSINLITNNHEGSEQEILPLAGLRSIRKGGRIELTCGYMLPTVVCVSGFYLLAEREQDVSEAALCVESKLLAESQQRRLWQGIDEMDRDFMAEIKQTLLEGDGAFELAFDFDVADSLNTAILDAVWDDCQHNPNLFYLFHRQARQFGKGHISGRVFMQYLEVSFGLEGASYLVDFLLHVLPEEELRKQLLRARWIRVRRQLSKRVLTLRRLDSIQEL
uniref:PX domain-containing protein n=1 Tax=Peronospora matthiolae TaxID=2874970 RepID=A0AAV1UC46_9STRA